MTHKNEDELLAFALDVVAAEKERAGIAAHLECCPECLARMESIRADIGTIAGVRPCSSAAAALEKRPHASAARASARGPHQFPGYALLRAAALVAVGVIVGFGAGSRAHREPVFVSPAYVEASAPAASTEASAVSDATDIPAEYYEQLVNKSE
jgi:anti-sigma factor RsiW